MLSGPPSGPPVSMGLTNPVENHRDTAGQQTSTDNGESHRQNSWGGTGEVGIKNEIPHASLNHQDRKGGESSHAKPPTKSSHGLFLLYKASGNQIKFIRLRGVETLTEAP